MFFSVVCCERVRMVRICKAEGTKCLKTSFFRHSFPLKGLSSAARRGEKSGKHHLENAVEKTPFEQIFEIV